jgi:SAM-dependent methyltransferase
MLKHIMKQQKSSRLTKKHYTEQVKREWRRLVKDPFHRLELDTTLRFLKKHLPKKGLILDAGGGPGRYTIELAKLGYDVILLDITPENLEFAKRQIKGQKIGDRVKAIVGGSITNLSEFPTGSFDAVLCLGGPLSHVGSDQRLKAVSELVRVAKKGAPLFVSVMGLFGLLNLLPWSSEIVQTRNFKRVYTKGEDYKWAGTGYCHFFTRDELCKLMLQTREVKVLETIGLEGLSSSQQEAINKLYKKKKAWKNWLDMHYHTCTHPTVVDLSQHIMIICKKL